VKEYLLHVLSSNIVMVLVH